LPNFTTVMALCVGLSSVRFALLEQWEMAVTAILIACILDAMDGRLARFLGSASRFGAELDSLADFVSFGVSPALVMYFISLHKWHGKGWAVVLFYTVCSALRLARFNTRSIEGTTPPWSQAYFSGVPIPAAATLALWPLIAYFEWKNPLFIHPMTVSVVMILVGLLMISHLPTFSFKTVNIPPRWQRPLLLLAAFLASALFSAPWITLCVIGIGYLATFPLSIRCYLKDKPKDE
jgi:CDP-diacylglycerol---serine O-phosphatidyltransferase